MTLGNVTLWEKTALGISAAAAVTLRILEENGVLNIPFLPVMIVLMILAAVLLLWRAAALFVKLAALKKHGIKTTASVIERRREKNRKGESVIEVISFKGTDGKKRRLSVDGTYSTGKRREYTLYYDPENEEEYILSPPCFIAMWIDIGFAVLAEGVFTAVLLMNVGG